MRACAGVDGSSAPSIKHFASASMYACSNSRYQGIRPEYPESLKPFYVILYDESSHVIALEIPVLGRLSGLTDTCMTDRGSMCGRTAQGIRQTLWVDWIADKGMALSDPLYLAHFPSLTTV
jgi:hypothetical protein